jgi:cytochrome c peroxidase
MKKTGFLISTFFFLSITGCWIQLKNANSSILTEIDLGRKLFFDTILSENNSISCATCHIPEFAFADTIPLSIGLNGQKTARNTPSAMNVAGRPYLFWDGRSPNLEDQVLHPILNSVEMGFNIEDLMNRLVNDRFYSEAFQQIYHHKPTAELLSKAIASYERILETGNSTFDYFMQGDSTAISAAAIRGKDLFIGKAGCFDCHFSPDFTGDEFRNIGLFNDKLLNDSGRFNVTKNPSDIGKFKVPGLRNVALTAPYMHNGMFKDLETVVDYYNNPDAFVTPTTARDALIKPLHLSELEKKDLVEFMKSLTAITLKK